MYVDKATSIVEFQVLPVIGFSWPRYGILQNELIKQIPSPVPKKTNQPKSLNSGLKTEIHVCFQHSKLHAENLKLSLQWNTF